jgi:hypothetical protein
VSISAIISTDVEVFKAVQRRQFTSPRTVLGFYAGVLVILDSASLLAIGVLAETHTMAWLIPWILGFGAVVFVGLIGGVFTINIIDPGKLMLGQISGTEYVAMHKIPLGDSLAGERETVVIQEEMRVLSEPLIEALPLLEDQRESFSDE